MSRILIIFLIFSTYCSGQNDLDSLSRTQETLPEVFPQGKNHHFTVGVNTDVVNSISGVTISNGIDEKPLIHFEDFGYDCIYKLSGQTNFVDDYLLDARLGWNDPSRRLLFITITLLSIDYSQKKITQENFHQRKFNLTTEFFFKSLPFSVIAKIGGNEINSVRSFGGEIGLREAFRKIYFEVNFGKYNEFNSFAVISQFNLYKSLYMRLVFENFDDFESLNLGLQYKFTTYKVNNR